MAKASSTKAHTSDGEARPNQQKAAPVIPPPITSMSESARVGVLNDYGTLLNEQLAYWAGTTLPINVIDRNAAYSHNGVVGRINDIIMGMGQACVEHGILTGAGQRMIPFTSLGYNAFPSVMARINAQLVAMQAALP